MLPALLLTVTVWVAVDMRTNAMIRLPAVLFAGKAAHTELMCEPSIELDCTSAIGLDIGVEVGVAACVGVGVRFVVQVGVGLAVEFEAGVGLGVGVVLGVAVENLGLMSNLGSRWSLRMASENWIWPW
jgi:hypothetical protein